MVFPPSSRCCALACLNDEAQIRLQRAFELASQLRATPRGEEKEADVRLRIDNLERSFADGERVFYRLMSLIPWRTVRLMNQTACSEFSLTIYLSITCENWLAIRK